MFRPVSPKVNFVEIEKKLLNWWRKTEIVKKYLQKNKNSKKKFSFLDGPITANNPMGVHHAWGRTYKDLWQRFFNMRGFRQRFQNGFDNQGLWVEVEVEKELGFKSKKDIEKYGIEKFVNKCKQRTLHFANIQTEQSKRLGYFMDWDNSYYTMSDENNYMIWYFLKKCHQNGWLYKGRDSVPWCPRCGTAISQHEILTEEYQEITHDSIYFKLPVEDKKNWFFLVWTTTPWTILANVALAVNPEFTYGAYQKNGEVLILLKDLKEKILGKEGQKFEEFKGDKLRDWRYQGPFDDLPRLQKVEHRVVLEKDLVTATEGTGIVHIAPGAGQEDFRLGKKEKLTVVEAIDEQANYLEGFGKFSGKNAKIHPELIINHLKEIDNGKFFFKAEPYTHRYPVCWRCKTELVWRVVDEWYIAMDPLREAIKKAAKKIHWIPSWGLEMELDWLKNMQDWLISKKRYWGLALPIWECSCGHFEVVGSKEELRKKAISGWEKFSGHTPHRPWIDEIRIRCSSCGGVASRIPDVGNPWLDAGIVPFSTLEYRTSKVYWREWFPADFITECFPGQFKNWFYSLLVMSTVLENTNPFRAIFGYALVRDEKGEEMHKSKGNAIWFDEAAEKMGVDVMRWMYVTQNPEINLNFGYHKADETRRKFHLMLWNVYNFFITYANVDKFRVKEQENKRVEKNILDRWIISRFNQLIQVVTDSLDKYDAFTPSHAIEDFVIDLSTWYVRRSRDRVSPTVPDGDDKNACYSTLYEVLVTLCKLLAPFTPFLAEEIYQNLTGGESVHLADWPISKPRLIDDQLLWEMVQLREMVERAHAIRKKHHLKVRQPLSRLVIIGEEKREKPLWYAYEELIKGELNVKKIEYKPYQEVCDKKGKLPGYSEDDPRHFFLDLKVTPKLKAEGEARELVRQIQELRKKAGCKLDQKVKVYGPKWPREEYLLEYIKRETLATALLPGKELKIATLND